MDLRRATIVLLVIFLAGGYALGRQTITINSNWQFFKGDIDQPFDASADVSWEHVTLPHTWNAFDPFDKIPGYYRGPGWYRRVLDMRHFPRSERIFIRFEAANQVADVFVNGEFVGTHKGGYTAFCYDITDYLKEGRNWLMVRVDNSHDPNIVPLKGDFNFYGGIYRDVRLIFTHEVHFDILDHAGPGVFVSTPDVTSEVATVNIRALITAHIARPEGIAIRITVNNSNGVPVAVAGNTIAITAGGDPTQWTTQLKIDTPSMWSPAHPYLYRVHCAIFDPATEEVLDQLVEPLGIRTFAFDADLGFTLNGERLKLIGVNRHQDFPGKGNALSNAEHLHDMQLIKEMGANVYRPAHYPQDPAVLDGCDRLGLLVMMEIPLDHDQTNSPEFFRNTRRMMREMIRQYYNHPSIIIWAYMNEMFLGRRLDRDREKIDSIVTFAHELDEMVRQEDPTRYTMIPNHGDFNIYYASGLTSVPMIVGWNLYYGWYEPDFEGFGAFMDHAHRTIPDKPMIITEYGAGAHPRIRSMQPARFDFSLEWESSFHQNHLKQIDERPFIAGSCAWNMFDFGSEGRADAMPYVNNKGLCTFDRKPKDAYYVYKAWLSDEPYLHLAMHNHPYLFVTGDINGQAQLPVQVFGNTRQAELVLNGISQGIRSLQNRAAEWQVGVSSGLAVYEVYDPAPPRKLMDRKALGIEVIGGGNVIDVPVMSCNFGSSYYYEEEHSGVVWVPGKAYDNDAWGSVGGEAYNPRDRGVGTDRPIAGTPDDPLWQTQLVGVEGIVFHVPAGSYQVRLLFAEIQRKKAGERVFSVNCQDSNVLRDLDIASECGQFTAAEYTIDVYAADGKIAIGFVPVTGEPVINAVQVLRAH